MVPKTMCCASVPSPAILKELQVFEVALKFEEALLRRIKTVLIDLAYFKSGGARVCGVWGILCGSQMAARPVVKVCHDLAEEIVADD